MSGFKLLLNNLDTLAPTLPLIVFLFRKNKVAGWYWLLLFLVIQVTLNGYANYKADNKQNNIFIYQVNCVVSFVLLAGYFGTLFKNEKFFTAYSIFSGLVLLFLIYLSAGESEHLFNSKTFSLTSVSLVFYSLLYFALQVYRPDMVPILKKSSFWIVTGIFTYYAANFFIFTFFGYFSTTNIEATVMGTLWRIHNIIFLIMNLYISKGFLCRQYQKI